MRTVFKVIAWAVGVIAGLIILVFIGSFFIDRPVRYYTEKEMNKHLKDYTVHVGSAHFQPIGFSLTLKDVEVIQQARPKPSVAFIPTYSMSIHWRAIFLGRLVGDLEIDGARLHINLPQLENESKRKFSVKREGWQQAVEAIYPLKINHLGVHDADLVYIDKDPSRPLHISHLDITATNIRNIESPQAAYPSPIHAEGIVFRTGKALIDGHADFLKEPFAGVNAKFKLDNVPLERFKPVLERRNVSINGGTISTYGKVEYAPGIEIIHIPVLTLSGVKVDYIHTQEQAPKEKAAKMNVVEAEKKTANKPNMTLRLDKLSIVDSEVGMINEAKNPPYRVYISNLQMTITNLSNHFSQGPAGIILKGKFMGSGDASVKADFRPEKTGPDLDLKLAVENTDLTKMDDLFKAYGHFDIKSGLFSLFIELHIKNGQITGYIKPIFKNMNVYDKRKEAEKSLFHKLYVMLIGRIAKFLENPNRKAVATETPIKGSLEKPKTSTWQIIINLIENAFIHAILPGFERQVSGGSG